MRFSLLLALFPSLALAGSVRGKITRAQSADSVVYIADIPGKTFPAPPKPVTMTQKNQTFTPRVMAVLRGTTVRFPNDDQVRHNVFSPAGPQPFNLGIYPPGTRKEMTFDKVGVVMLLCNIHENMSAYILVLQNPYFTTPKDGRFVLDGVPDGSYTLTLWSEGKPPITKKIVVRGDVEVDF